MIMIRMILISYPILVRPIVRFDAVDLDKLLLIVVSPFCTNHNNKKYYY